MSPVTGINVISLTGFRSVPQIIFAWWFLTQRQMTCRMTCICTGPEVGSKMRNYLTRAVGSGPVWLAVVLLCPHLSRGSRQLNPRKLYLLLNDSGSFRANVTSSWKAGNGPRIHIQIIWSQLFLALSEKPMRQTITNILSSFLSEVLCPACQT